MRERPPAPHATVRHMNPNPRKSKRLALLQQCKELFIQCNSMKDNGPERFNARRFVQFPCRCCSNKFRDLGRAAIRVNKMIVQQQNELNGYVTRTLVAIIKWMPVPENGYAYGNGQSQHVALASLFPSVSPTRKRSGKCKTVARNHRFVHIPEAARNGFNQLRFRRETDHFARIWMIFL